MLEVTSHSINLTWEAIPQEDRRGELEGYRLCVSPYVKDNSAESGCLQNALVAKPWRTAAVVTNLKPYTVYSVRIRGFTSKGEGPLSTAVHVRTEEGGKESFDADLTLVSNAFILIFTIYNVAVLLQD